MNVLVKDINVLLMLRIHTNYYIVCRVISPPPQVRVTESVMPDFNELFSPV